MACFQCPWEPHCHALIHLTFGAAILLHGRISKIRPRHDIRKDAGYNHDRGQWVPIGYARPASGGQKGPCITWHDPLGCLGGFMPCLTAPRVRTKVRRTHTYGVLYTSFILCQQSRVKRDTAIRLSRLLSDDVGEIVGPSSPPPWNQNHFGSLADQTPREDPAIAAL